MTIKTPDPLTLLSRNPNFKQLQTKHYEVLLHALKLPDLYESCPNLEESKKIHWEELVVSLYWRSPASFILERSTDQLVAILTELGHAYRNYLLSANGIHMSLVKDQGVVRFFIICPDRPFIIRSLITVFEDLALNVNILIHPVFVRQNWSISSVYIELEEYRDHILDDLQARCRQALQDVLELTSDYSAMYQQTEQWAQELGSTTLNLTGQTASSDLEIAELLRWLTHNNFLFAGSTRWLLSKSEDSEEKTILEDHSFTKRGILRNAHPDNLTELCQSDCALFANSPDAVFGISRLPARSRVQRPQRLAHLMFKLQSSESDQIHSPHIYSLIGLFTITASQQSCTEIPLIRSKLARIIKLESVPRGSYDYKFIVRALDNMPKELALNLPIETLRAFINIAIGVHNHNRTRLALHWSQATRRADILVAVPKHSFNSRVESGICEYLEKRLGCSPSSCEIYLDHSADHQVRAYLHLPIPEEVQLNDEILTGLEEEISQITRTWSEKLEAALRSSIPFPRSLEVLKSFSYGQAFPPEYKAVHSAGQCHADIQEIQKLVSSRKLSVNINCISTDTASGAEAEITIYSSNINIPTNKSLPIFDNLGLTIKANTTYEIRRDDQQIYYIHRFVTNPTKLVLQNPNFEAALNSNIFKEGVIAVLEGVMENDVINNLLLGAALPHRAISVLRAYAGYLWQVIKYATRGTIYHTLAQSPQQSALLWQLFTLRFDPDYRLTNNPTDQEALITEYIDSLRAIKSINQDRILRSLLRVIVHTHRTNFYQQQSMIAFKIHSKALDILSEPKPLYEIYVRSTQFEGVHLRGGRTARGGIRWSERTEDYRSEILGLMKTQIIKNVLIVPTGAKGGFAVRYLPEDPVAVRAKVEECYKQFIRALLSITDNLVDGKIITPPKVVAHDQPDPYLVVAADKGTATFSDLANSIAQEEFNFWLGDAFASGGSNGYDHKKYGITAKGAWESVKRHFNDLKFDYLNKPFTAIGIGDMSGDVFGNGLLLSQQIKLVAAFNHIQIFIDPDPDPQIAFVERKRLFELPRSQWKDYSQDLISAGGGVFDRFAKEIQLSQAARKALGIADEVPQILNGEEVIRLILQAPVMLLWNGGIGTYVKSSTETNATVNDGTNDQVRIDANELRCKIVGEGGNLGFTQSARIEFARRGGRIISDAIDNSGGVDLSDHEVNIKLALAELVKTGTMSEHERNLLLVEIVPEVVEQVLSHNKNHSSILSLGSSRSLKSIHYFQSLIRQLERSGYIDRTLENLPTAEDLLERASKKEGLYVPELAVCMAAVKMWIKDQLVQSTLVNDPLLEGYLLDYFPAMLRSTYNTELTKHPLRSEIIATQVTNSLIDAIGITFVQRMCMTHSVSPITVVKCILAAELLLGSKEVRQKVRIFDNPQQNDQFMRVISSINEGVRHATSRLIGWHGQDLPLDQMVELYRAPHSSLILAAELFFPENLAEQISSRLKDHQNFGLSESIARRLVLFEHTPSCFDILASVRASQTDATCVGKTYFNLLKVLRLEAVLELEEKVETVSKWEHQVLLGAFESIRSSLSRLVTSFLTMDPSGNSQNLNRLVTASPSYFSHVTSVEEIQADKPSALSLSVLARQLENFSVAQASSL